MQTAKLFTNGRSQAVRLPKEFRFTGDDVYIKLGAIALENSQTAEAAALSRRALELNPENHTLQTKLDQIGASEGA